jgi:beta-glucosidase-like glycosyl hydrolase
MNILPKLSWLLLLCALVPAGGFAQDLFPGANQRWADSVFSTLSVDQKIGQLMMPRGNYSGQGYDTARLHQIVRDYHVGGLVMFAGQPTKQAELVNRLQRLARVPLFIGMDLEWGLAMRLDSTVRFPYAMTLGALPGQPELIEEMGYQVAQQCKRMGVHINYAPVADVNNNPNNPVINFRSFGENPAQVAQKALAYMRGLQRGGVITSAKHFPGHGDTGVDSHYDLPLISHSRARLDSIELYPYRELIKHGLQGVMVGHLNIPTLDDTKNLASTMSKKIVTDLLRTQLTFQGLVFTDAMDMQGAVKHFPEGTANVKAILAGVDVLETFFDVPAAFNAIKKALANGEISQAEIDRRVRTILRAKAWAGLDRYRPIGLKNLVADLNPTLSATLNQALADKTITVLRNERNLLPLQKVDKLKLATLQIGKPGAGAAQPADFQQAFNAQGSFAHFQLDAKSDAAAIERVRQALKKFDVVVVAVDGMNIRPAKDYGIAPANQNLVKEFANSPKAVVVVFGNAYTLAKYENLTKAGAVVLTYQEGREQQKAAAKLVMGAIGAQGKLPVTVNGTFGYGQGLVVAPLKR